MPTPVLQSRWFKTAAALTTFFASAATWAHEGHSMEGSHWHATDSWGLLAVAAAAALYLYRHK
jgi:hypothetical protein